MEGQVIDSIYEITERLGSGRGGVVYKARHLRLDRDVAVKIDKRKLKKEASYIYVRSMY